jgi:hypothetical protein
MGVTLNDDCSLAGLSPGAGLARGSRGTDPQPWPDDPRDTCKSDDFGWGLGLKGGRGRRKNFGLPVLKTWRRPWLSQLLTLDDKIRCWSRYECNHAQRTTIWCCLSLIIKCINILNTTIIKNNCYSLQHNSSIKRSSRSSILSSSPDFYWRCSILILIDESEHFTSVFGRWCCQSYIILIGARL